MKGTNINEGYPGEYVKASKREFVKINQNGNTSDINMVPRNLDYLQHLRELFYPLNSPIRLVRVNLIIINFQI